MKKRVLIRGLCILLCSLSVSLAGCQNPEQSVPSRQNKTEAATKDSKTETVAVLLNIDSDEKNIYFMEAENDAADFLSYNGATVFLSRSGNAIAASQLSPGDVVDITYHTGSRIISQVQISKNEKVWDNLKVTSFSVDETTHSMKIGQSLYSYTEELAVFSDGEQIDIMELNSSMDQLRVRGYGNKIVSIVVDKGHGYLSLSGDSLFIGGLISISGVLVRNIESEMLLAVTEGTYKVEVVNGSYSADKYVTITRGEQSIVDFSDIAAQLKEVGNLRFNIDVAGAELYIDGEKYNPAEILSIPTGKHVVTVISTGYDTYSETIDVDASYRVIDIKLAAGGEEESSEAATEGATKENETSSGNTVSSVNTVTVTAPEGAGIYFDGTYKGKAPVTFPLVTGAHLITVLEGTTIRSYSVNLAEGGDDVVYDFSD